MLDDYPAIATLPVQWGDQDLFGHVNNAVYIRWLETARVEYWYRSGLQEAMQPLGLGPILASIHCDYKRQIRFPDTVLIGAKVSKLGTSSVTLQHAIASQGNREIAALGQSVIVLFDYEKQHPVPINDEIRAIFERFDTLG